MLFTALLTLPAVLFCVIIVISIIVVMWEGLASALQVFAFGALVSFFTAFPCLMTWSEHAGDLAVIKAQSGVIAVYQERVNSLEGRLNSADYPSGSLVNADTPIAAIVMSLTDAESELARAKAKEAQAKVNIERTRAGPMSGVIAWAGDYK